MRDGSARICSGGEEVTMVFAIKYHLPWYDALMR